MQALILSETQELLLDLDSHLTVHTVESLVADRTVPSSFRHQDGELWVTFEEALHEGESLKTRVKYGGEPLVARRPPWVGGFVWAKDREGAPWIGVACQIDGADLWWPSKDHPSDEPERMDIRITVPEPLVAVSNGRLLSKESNSDGTQTFHWQTLSSISNYAVTVNIGRYRRINGSYRSVAGRSIPISLWVLREHYQDGIQLFPQIPQHLRFLENTLGPYPFRHEKYGVAEAPFLGMEHQTIVAYGGGFRNNRNGFDSLHLHELAHEWWGNQLTVSDWKDYWLHEGFASYLEALYAESLEGPDGLHNYMKRYRRLLRNESPVGPGETRNSVDKYFIAPDFTQTDGDVYYKAAWILHTLRHLLGDQVFFRAVREFINPEGTDFKAESCHCRLVSGDEFQTFVARLYGSSLDWFFENYLRHPELPTLQTKRTPEGLELRWETVGNVDFPMPVTVKVAGTPVQADFQGNRAFVPAPADAKIVIDPEDWILRSTPEELGGAN
jgi:aminopeptidase N